MTHCLRERDQNSPWANPFVLTARYRCECATNEVLSISVVLDLNATEEQFIWTMKRLRDDVKFEVRQHLKAAAGKAA